MKYNLSPDLISTEFIPWVDEYVQKHQDITSEFYPPALWSSVAQTLAEYNGVITEPSSQEDIKYIYSKAFRPYSLFKMHWNNLTPKIVHGKNGYAIKTNVDFGTIGDISVSYTETSSLEVKQKAEISSLSIDSITANHISSTIGIIKNLKGDKKIKYDNAEISNIFTNNITATGTAQLTAFRVRWADVAEMYQADEKYEPGTLVEFSGKNEITLATSNVNGCISKSPAFRLNSGIRNETSLPIVLVGKTKVKVVGIINKFDRLELSDIPGTAKSHTNKKIIGIALESNSNKNIKLVESIVKLTL